MRPTSLDENELLNWVNQDLLFPHIYKEIHIYGITDLVISHLRSLYRE